MILVLVSAFPPLLLYLITLFTGFVLAVMPTLDRPAGPVDAHPR